MKPISYYKKNREKENEENETWGDVLTATCLLISIIALSIIIGSF